MWPFGNRDKKAPESPQKTPKTGRVGPVFGGKRVYSQAYNIDRKLFRNAAQQNWYGSSLSRVTAVRAMRKIAAESPIVNSYLNKVTTNVVGWFCPRPTFTNLSNNELREPLMKVWKTWSTDPTVNGGDNLSSVLRAMLRDMLIDGRTFAIIRYNSDYPHYGIGIMPVTRDWLYDLEFHDKERKVQINGGSYIMSNGVLRDEVSGRIKYYAFYGKTNPQDVIRENELGNVGWFNQVDGKEPVYIPAENVIDFHVPQGVADFDGGISSIINVLATLEKIEDYDQATLQLMTKASENMALLTPDTSAPPLAAAMDKDPDLDYPPTDIEGGKIRVTPPGYKVQSLNPASPSADMSEFKKNLLRQACAALGVDYATVCSDMREVNFSSIRAGIQQSRDYYRVLQEELEQRVLRPLLKAVVEAAAMQSELRKLNRQNMREICETDFRHRSHQSVDPSKDAAYYEKLIAMGALSPQEVTESEGRDWEQTQEYLAAAVAAAEADGRIIPGMEEKVEETISVNSGGGGNSDD